MKISCVYLFLGGGGLGGVPLDCHDDTSLKVNIEAENLPCQKESSLPNIIFQGLC